MKWLVISDNSKNIKSAHECLAACGQKDNINEFDLKNFSIDKLVPLLEYSDHAMIFTENVEAYSSVISFVAGFYTGRKNTVFACGDKKAICKLGVSAASCFSDAAALFDTLKKSYSLLSKAQAKREAYEYLFEKGMPFTPDSFAVCISKDKLDLCQCYVAAGMSVNVRTSEGTPMLNIAVRAEHIDGVEWLLDRGADIDAVSDDRGYTAVMDAVWRGNKNIVSMLVGRGAALDTVSKEGQTMLVLAVGAGRADICRILSDNGESPDIPDAMGMSAYAYAKLFRNEEIVAILEKNHKES